MTYRPLPGTLLVKPIETHETQPGGVIVLLDSTRERLLQLQAEVLACGSPVFCENEECGRVHWTSGWGPETQHVYPDQIKPGAWILMEPRQLVETLTPGLFVLAKDAVIAVIAP